MTDKVQKIKDWISKEQEGLMDAQGNFEYPEHEGAYHILCNLDTYIDSMQEEPVSEELEESACSYVNDFMDGELGFNPKILKSDCKISDASDELEIVFKAGAQWQKEQLLKDAVERIVKVDAGGYPYIDDTELYDYSEDKPLAKAGDKVKIVIIKEESV